MWPLFARAPGPAAIHWPGRRVLAVIDAVAWPALVACVVSVMTASHGLAGDLVIATCAVLAVRRTWLAAFVTWRYRFTTWRWGVPLATLAVLGMAMKLSA